MPETNPIQDIAGNDAAALADQAVTNTLDATAPEAVASLTASNTSTFGEVDLQWDGDTWANGSAITRHEVRYGAPIWSATLTVKDLGSNFLGCDTTVTNLGCEPGELLTDRAFSYDSVDYLIDTIDLIGGQLRLITNRSTITAASLADLTLDVGGLSFPFADATHSAGALTWTGAGLSWSEDDMVPLAISTISSLPWTSISDSAPGEANETSHTLEGLDPGEEYTFQVRAVNDVGGGGEASDTLTLLAPEWSFTLRDSGGNDITELTEGGASATAAVTITNAGQATFGTDQTITLEWGNFSLEHGRIQGAGNTSAFTILAGASTGHLDLSVPDNEVNPVYFPNEAHDLTATWEGDVIGIIMDLRSIDDESPPVARITDAPESVNEGDTIDIDIELSVRYSGPGALRFTITDSDSALSGTLPDRVVLAGSELTATVTLTAAENTVQNDGARTVTFTLETSTDIPYTLGTPKTVTIIVRDDDTPPLAVGDLRAQAGNTEATLRWDAPPAPTPDHGQPILHYEYRVKEGTASFGSWAMIPNSDGTTTSHKFTGLTNETEYTYEVRAENVAGDGADASVSVTPRIGVAVSFGAASASITEGGSSAVTLTLGEAPATGVTVDGADHGDARRGTRRDRVFRRAHERDVRRGRYLEELHGVGGGRRAGRTGRGAHAGAGDAAGRLRAGDQRRDRHHGGGRRRGGVGAHPDRLQRQCGDGAHRGRRFRDRQGLDHQQRAVRDGPDDHPRVGRPGDHQRAHPGRGRERDHHHHRRAIERHTRRQRPAAPGRPVPPAGDRDADRHARRGPDRRRHPARIRRRRGPTRTHHPPEGHQGRRERLGVPGRNALAGIRHLGGICPAARPGNGGHGQAPHTCAERRRRTADRTPQFRTGTDHEPLDEHDAHRQLDGGGPRHDHLHHPVEPGLLHHRRSVDGDAADPGRRRRAGRSPEPHRKAGGHRGDARLGPPGDLRPDLGQRLPVPPARRDRPLDQLGRGPGQRRRDHQPHVHGPHQ